MFETISNQIKEKSTIIKAFLSGAHTRNTLSNDDDTRLLRAALFSIEQLNRHAVKLAGQHKIDTRPGPDRLLPRLADNEHVLLAAYDVVAAAAIPEQRIVPAEAWLLDNFYLIEQQISLARRHRRAATAGSYRDSQRVCLPDSPASMTWP